jgi:hypothetical protein
MLTKEKTEQSWNSLYPAAAAAAAAATAATDPDDDKNGKCYDDVWAG